MRKFLKVADVNDYVYYLNKKQIMLLEQDVSRQIEEKDHVVLSLDMVNRDTITLYVTNSEFEKVCKEMEQI